MLGGTFNPPHHGHLALAAYAREQLGLARVLLMPAHASPHKGDAPDPGPRRRLEMCELAVVGQEGVDACALEVERGGTSYTVDTLRRIEATHPHAELTFIVGADVATGMPGWREPEEILRLATLAVVSRSGSDRAAVEEALARVPGDRNGRGVVAFLDMPAVDVSSSMVRARTAAGEPIDGLVPDAVAAYIAEHALYGAPSAASAAGAAVGPGGTAEAAT